MISNTTIYFQLANFNYIISILASIPVVGFNAVLMSEHFGAFLAFAVLHGALAIRYARVIINSSLTTIIFKYYYLPRKLYFTIFHHFKQLRLEPSMLSYSLHPIILDNT